MSDWTDLCRLLCADATDRQVARNAAGQAVTLSSLRLAAAAWEATFAALHGQAVALHFEDTLDFSAALFGAWHAGKIVYLPGELTAATLQALGTQVAGLASDAAEDFALPRLRPSPAAEPQQALPLNPQAEQLVLFTSGSTGEPQAITKRLEQLFVEVAAQEQAFGARAGQAEVLGTVSHQHIYGLLFRVLWPLASGRLLHARRLAYIEDLPLALRELPNAALLIASPAHLKRLPPALPDDSFTARVALVFSSGGPLPDDALPDCRRLFGQAPIEVYGSSETGGIAWRQRSGEKHSPVWRALPGVAWRVDGERLQVSSAHLAEAGWHDSDDRVRASEEGFELLGRLDRVLKIEGKRVSLQAIEQALLATEWLAELRVLVLPGLREQLAVVGVPTEAGWALHTLQGRAALADALRRHLQPQLETMTLPRRWRFVSRLPANAQGKATAQALQALFDPRRPAMQVLSQSATDATLRIWPDATLPQFDGHFSGHPVLPGVAQVEWALLFAQELFGLPGAFRALEALKFQQVIRPGQVLQMQLTMQAAQGKLVFKLESDAGPHASGRVVFDVPASEVAA
ncbi:MAG TPA: AMP-binding protein [Ideonella sp.]|uniref:AMP-binding protein n=1 Tax=Ideonella sp. TaxID=1929293 RepID=UPI002B901065|nr:AMP-binding protein [Ideonella sp.]HSI46663.1 AMP-binding protein [Ideonella sp.]